MKSGMSRAFHGGHVVGVIGCFILAAACSQSGARSDDESTGSLSEAVVNGTNDNLSLEANTVVALENPAMPGLACSGILITPRVVLTASACVVPAIAGPRPNVRVGANLAIARTFFASTQNADVMTGAGAAKIALVYIDPDHPVLEEAKAARQTFVSPPALPWDPSAPETAYDYRNMGVAGWSPLDADGLPRPTSASIRQQYTPDVMRVYADTAPTWVRDVTSMDGALTQGDLGGPIFVTDPAGARQVVGIATMFGVGPSEAAGCPPTAQRCDVWDDVTVDVVRSWIREKVQINPTDRTSRWFTAHDSTRVRTVNGLTIPDWWLGEVDYTGPCIPLLDADCDHWYDYKLDSQGQPTTIPRDNCPGVWNPDQLDYDGDIDPNIDQLNAVSFSTECAGTALDEEWVLTSSHCAKELAKEVDTATLAGTGEKRLVRYSDGSSWDLGIVQVHPFSAVPGGAMKVWSGSTATLTGKQLKCAGRINSCMREWRSGLFRAVPDAMGLYVKRDTAAFELEERDEGAGCFYFDGGNRYLVSLQQTTEWNETTGEMVSRQLPLGPLSANISALINRSWFAGYRQPTKTFSIGFRTSDGVVSSGMRVSSQQSMSSWIWDSIVVLRNHTVLLYDRDSGAVQVGILARIPGMTILWDQQYVFVGQYSVEPGFTSVVNVGLDNIAFHNSTNRQLMAARLDTHGVFTRWPTMPGPGPIAPYPYLAGHRNGFLTFREHDKRRTMSITANLFWQDRATDSAPIIPGLTHVQPFGDNRLFEYASSSGIAWFTQVTADGHSYHIVGQRSVQAGFRALGMRTGHIILWNPGSSNVDVLSLDANNNIVGASNGWRPPSGVPGPIGTPDMLAAE